MNNFYIYLLILILLSTSYNIYIYVIDNKIKRFEKKILKLFYKRTNLVPILYEITKNHINKHNEVFSQILHLRKVEFFIYNDDFLSIINNEILIHHELNFIFKIANKHPKIYKDWNFLLVKDLFLENSSNIWNKVIIYKKVIEKFNFLVKFKNFTIVWLFIHIKEKEMI